MLESLQGLENGKDEHCNPFQAPPQEDSRMFEYRDDVGAGGGGGGKIGLREGILAGIVTFVACGAVFYFVITGLINTNSPYVKDKELIFQSINDNKDAIKETKNDIKKINESLYEIKLEINKANAFLYKLSEQDTRRR